MNPKHPTETCQHCETVNRFNAVRCRHCHKPVAGFYEVRVEVPHSIAHLTLETRMLIVGAIVLIFIIATWQRSSSPAFPAK